MAQIVFKSKKKEVKSKEQAAPSPALGILANFFHWFIVLACVAVLASGYLWLLKPKYQLIVNDDAFKREEKLYQDKVAYLRQLRDAKSAYDDISDEEKRKIDSLLSTGQDIETLKINLLRELTYLGKIYKAKIEDVQMTPLDNSQEKFITIVKDRQSALTNSNVQIITMDLTISEVDYLPLKRILERLERNLHLMDVVKFDYQPEDRQAILEIYTYYLNSSL